MCFRFTSFVEILLALSIIQQVEVYLKYTWSILEVYLKYAYVILTVSNA